MRRRLFEIGCACAVWPAARAAGCPEVACGAHTRAAWSRVRDDFDALAHTAAALAAVDRIGFANLAINRLVDYADDAELGAADVWSTPLETLARGRGDCEDIAIAKFFLLLASGTDPREVRLLYARLRDPARPGLATPHVVALAPDPHADPLVLDNLDTLALPVSLRPDLEPLFSFDCARLWVGVCGACRGSAPARLRIWRELLVRVAEQHGPDRFISEKTALTRRPFICKGGVPTVPSHEQQRNLS